MHAMLVGRIPPYLSFVIIARWLAKKRTANEKGNVVYAPSTVRLVKWLSRGSLRKSNGDRMRGCKRGI